MNINTIALKDGRKVSSFPTYEETKRQEEAKRFIEKDSKERSSKFNFVRQHLDKLRTEFQKEFNCPQSDADYFIFNSIRWE